MLDYLKDGAAHIAYPDGNSESIHLSEATWTFACKSAKKYCPMNTPPPNFLPVSQKNPQRCPSAEVQKLHRKQSKGFADDLTVISRDKLSHKQALSEIDEKCADLDLYIRPDKCVSLSFEGNKFEKYFKVVLNEGTTRNIAEYGVKFLGRLLIGTPKTTCSQSSNTLSIFRASLQAFLSARPIRGEYKLWIYQCYLAPSMHFYLAINPTSANAIKKAEAIATKALKKWLKLPRNATQTTLYHPEVLNALQLSNLKVKAKPSFLVSINQSTDRLIQELKPLLSVPNIIKGRDILFKCSLIRNAA